jgi:hypothetical protein
VPATLHASLLGRLDRLGPSAKNVAQVGAATSGPYDRSDLSYWPAVKRGLPAWG